MAKQTSTKVPSAPGPNRSETLLIIAGRVRLIGSRRSGAFKAIYIEAATILEKEAKKHGKATSN